MDLHDHAVVEAHLRQLGEHLRPEQLGLSWRGSPAAYHAVKRFRFVSGKIEGIGRRVPVVGGNRAVSTKHLSPHPDRR